MEKRLTAITEGEVNALRRKTAQALPDSPTRIGMRAADVKRYFYGAMTDENESIVAFLKRIITEANEALEEVEKASEESLGAHNTASNAHSELFAKKADANKDALSEIIGDASSSRKGLMTAQQAEDLETLVALMNDVTDGKVDTIAEVLAVFEEWNEGAKMADILAGKLDKNGGTYNVYATDAVGNQTTKKYSSDAEGGAIISRDANGRACVADAIASSDDTTIANVRTVKLIANNVALGELGDLRADVNQNSLRIKRLELGLPETEFETDASIAYFKEVPENVLPYAIINNVGIAGKRSSNLIIPDTGIDTVTTQNGLTFRLNSDGSFTVNGTATADTYFLIGLAVYYPNETYFLSGCPTGGGNGKFCLYSMDPGDYGLASTYDYGSGVSVTPEYYAEADIGIRVWKGTTITGKKFKPMVSIGTKQSYEKGFDGLQFAPVTSIKSYDGANLLSPPYDLTFDDEEQWEYIEVLDNGDGSITINGEADSPVQCELTTITLPKGTYILSGFPDEYMYSYFCIENVNNRSELYYSGEIFDVPVDTEFRVYFETESGGDTFDNVTFTPKLCVVSSDASNSLVDEIEIPREVWSDASYGLGIDDVRYNYIDFETKQLIKNVKKIVLNGSENWQQTTGGFYLTGFSDVLQSGSLVLCDRYKSELNAWKINYTIGIDTAGVLWVATPVTSLSSWKDALSKYPMTVVYAVDTPVRVNLSESLSDENLINIVPGGFITFENEHRYAVPSEVIYQKQEVAE